MDAPPVEIENDVTSAVVGMSLRPMPIGDLLDRAIFFYRSHFVTLIAFIALMTVPLILLSTLFAVVGPGLLLGNPDFIESNPMLSGGAVVTSYLGSIATSIFSTFFLFPIQAAGVGIVLKGTLLDGRRIALDELLREVRRYVAPLLRTGLIAMFLSSLLLITFIIPPIGLAFSLLFWVAFFVSVFVLLYEKKEGLQALRRGWILARESVWRLMGYLTLFYLFNTIFASLITGLLALGATGFSVVGDSLLLPLLAQVLATSLTSMLVMPLQFAVVGLLYFDLRVRHEGLDLALQAARGAGEPLDLSDVPASEEPVLNRRTWEAVAIIAGTMMAVLGVFCGCLVAIVLLAGG